MRLCGRMLIGISLFTALVASAAGAAPCKLLMVTELPVTIINGLPMIPVTINGHATQLLLDTGAQRSLLWRSAAQELNLRILSRAGSFYGVGGSDTAGTAWVDDFTLAGVTIHKVPLFVTGRGKLPGDSAGVLGEDVLSHYDLEFDLADNKIRLFDPKGCSGDQVVYWAPSYFVTKLQRAANQTDYLETEVDLDGHKFLAMIDSGANHSSISTQAVRSAGISSEVPLSASGAAHGLAGRAIETDLAIFKLMTIGQETIRNATLDVADLFSRSTAMELGSFIAQKIFDVDLIIGNDFLRAHRVYVSRKQDKMYFTYSGGTIFRRSPAAPTSQDKPAAP